MPISLPRPIRDAVIADLPAIVSIYNSTIASREVPADTEPVTVDSRVAWFQAHNPHHRPLWVWEDGNRIQGWLSFQSFYGRPAYGGTAELSLYIHPQDRRQGLGRQLLHAAVFHAPDVGVDRLLGFIFGHNRPSLTLFAEAGFEPWARLPGVAVLDGIRRDLVIVGRCAGEGV